MIFYFDKNLTTFLSKLACLTLFIFREKEESFNFYAYDIIRLIIFNKNT